MTWTVTIDESGTDGQSSILAMASVLAADSRWRNLEAEWRQMLARHSLVRIHCSQLRHDMGYDDARLTLVMGEIEQIILRHVPLSIVAVMRKDDYDDIYKPTKPVSGSKHSPLGVLYRASVSFFVAFLEQHPPPGLDKVNFVYERGVKEGGLQAIHADFQTVSDLEDWFGTLTFEGRDDRLWLQAADCLAAGALFHERIEHAGTHTNIADSGLVMAGQTPSSLVAPLSFRLPVTRTILETLRDELLLTRAQRTALAQNMLKSK